MKKRKKRWNLASIVRSKATKAKVTGNDGPVSEPEAYPQPQNDDDEQKLTRDLSLGGAVLLGLGAKQLFLPALALSHPLLLAITVPTALVTSRRYLSSLWDAGTGKGPLNTDALAGTATVAAVVSGGSATALAGVGVLNLGKYLSQKRAISRTADEQEGEANENIPTPSPASSQAWSDHFAKYAAPASLALGGLIFAPHFISLIPSVGASLAITNQLIAFLRTTRYAPLLYMSTYAVRPVVLPASLLTIAGGLLFGPYWGVLYSIVGSNASAMVNYLIARYLGERVTGNEQQKPEFVERYAERMRENPFESVLTMRILYLPYDLVSYLAGGLQIEWKPFLLATALGSLPGIITLVLLGASIQGNTISGIPRLNPSTLAASGVIFVSSLALSRYLKQEEEGDTVTGELGLA